MKKDFTINKYRQLLTKFRQSGYAFFTFEQWCKAVDLPDKYLIVRHDVDEMAGNALVMAQLENELGICATYSFRIVKQSNKPDIIRKIAALGHEIAYHYEDLAFAEGDSKVAIKTFRENLSYFRSFYDVKTISMHGSSTSQYDNRDLWKTYDFRDEGIIGEPYLTIDYSEIFYLTDTGYKWDGFEFSVRDVVDCSFPNVYHRTTDIIDALDSMQFPDKALMLAHTLWTDKKWLWSYIYCREKLRNKVKRISQNNRFIRKFYSNFVRFYWKR